MPKLSIILPVYNTEKYLEKCLNSIMNNSFTDYELIVINDGTKDSSEEIILKFKEKMQDKLIYISKENSGLSDTRNLGISLSKGEYISFIDSDDYIEPNMYEEMFGVLKNCNYDIVACDVRLVYEACDKTKIISSGFSNHVISKEDIKRSMLVQYPVVWNKIYKTSLVKNHLFSKGVWYEDMEFTLKLYPYITSVGVVKKPLYNYLQRQNSITYTYNDKLYDIINNMNSVLEEYINTKNYNEYKLELEYLYARYALATFIKRLAKCRDQRKYLDGVNYALSMVKKYFPEYKKNIYLQKMGLKGFYIKHFGTIFANLNYIVQNIKKYN